MRRISLITCLAATLLAIPFFMSRAAQQEDTSNNLALFTTEPKPSCAVGSENLLFNPSFEGSYSNYTPPNGHPDCPWGTCTTAQMADGWTPWWRSKAADDDPWINNNPEFKPAESRFVNPPRVKSGDRAQQYFTFYGTHEAGMLQRVSGLDSGSTYRFHVWGHSWSADNDSSYTDPNKNGEILQTVGIDPTGGTDWQSPNIIWGTKGVFADSYGEFALETIAQGDSITVFTYSQPQWAVKHNDVYWDDASLVRMTGGELNVSAKQAGGLTELGESRQVQNVIGIDLVGATSWDAQIMANGTLPIQINRTMGNSDDDLVITFDSADMALGSYETMVKLTASGCAGEALEQEIPVRLTVAEELEKVFIPITSH